MRKFTNHVSKLEQEINDISFNINKVKNKSHRTMSSIVEKIKLLSKSTPNILKNVEDTTTIESRNQQYISKCNLQKNNYISNLYDYNDIRYCNKKKQKNLNHINPTSLEMFNKSSKYKKKCKSNLNLHSDIRNINLKKNEFEFKFLKYPKDDIEYIEDINCESEIKNNYFNKSHLKNNDETSNKLKYPKCTYNKKYIVTLKENSEYFKTKNGLNNDKMKKKIIMNNDIINNDISFKNASANQLNRNQGKNINIVKPKIIKYMKTEILNTNGNINNNNVNNIKNKIIINKNTIENSKNSHNSVELDQIIKLMNVQNIDDAILKLKKLKKRKEFYYKIKNIYCQSRNTNSYNNIIPAENECEKIISWVKYINTENKEIELYEHLCKNIMYDNNIKNFNEFKIFLNEILRNMKKNEKFFGNLKQICQNEFVPELINGKEIDNFEKNFQTQSNSGI